MHALARYGLLVTAGLLPGAALAASIIDTSDAGEIAAFRAGLTVEDLEGLNGLATATPTDNVIVLAGNQLSKVGSGLPDVQSLPGLHFHSGGGTFGGGPGTPVAVLDVDGSAGNLIVPLEINTDVTCVDIGCFLEIFFDTPVQKAGFDVGLGDVMILAQTSGGNPLGGVDFATGTAGNFAGIARDAADIERLVVLANSANGFTMDNLSYGTAPEPSAALLLATGAALLGTQRRR
jgi:hypothetical protein